MASSFLWFARVLSLLCSLYVCLVPFEEWLYIMLFILDFMGRDKMSEASLHHYHFAFPTAAVGKPTFPFRLSIGFAF